jgi:hypothetical protein
MPSAAANYAECRASAFSNTIILVAPTTITSHLHQVQAVGSSCCSVACHVQVSSPSPCPVVAAGSAHLQQQQQQQARGKYGTTFNSRFAHALESYLSRVPQPVKQQTLAPAMLSIFFCEQVSEWPAAQHPHSLQESSMNLAAPCGAPPQTTRTDLSTVSCESTEPQSLNVTL